MKKQLFLSAVLLVASMEVLARIGGAGSGGAAPASKNTGGGSRVVPQPQPTPPVTPTGAGASAIATQTVANHPGHEKSLIAGALEAVGESLEGYTVPTSSDTLAYDAYMGGKQYASTGKVS